VLATPYTTNAMIKVIASTGTTRSISQANICSTAPM
jgi:hypothetical protein